MKERFITLIIVAQSMLVLGGLLFWGGATLGVFAYGRSNVDTLAGSATIAYCGLMALGLGGCLRVLLAIESNQRADEPAVGDTTS